MEIGITAADNKVTTPSEQPQFDNDVQYKPVVNANPNNTGDNPYMTGLDNHVTKPYMPSVVQPTIEPSRYRDEIARIKQDEQSFTETELRQDPYFIEAARNLIQFQDPDNVDMYDDETIMSTALSYIGQVNYNIPATIAATLEYDDADETTMASVAYLLEAYEAKEIDAKGIGRVAYGLASDPSTYFSAVSLGAAAPVQAAAKMTAYKTFMSFAKSKLGVATAEAATYSGLGTDQYQRLEEDVGLKDYSMGETVAATALGAAVPKALQEGFKGAFKGVNKLLKSGEKAMAQVAGGGMPTAQNIIDSTADMKPKDIQKTLSGSLRNLEGEEKMKMINHLKSMHPAKKKPKAKVQKVINEREEFNEQFYSKAEHEFNKIKDDGSNVYDTLVKNGVKKSEIDTLGITPETGYNEAKNQMNFRNDKITKNTIDADTEGALINEDDYIDYINVEEGTTVSEGDQGYGALVRNEYTGEEIEIGYSTVEGAYVDQNGADVGDYNDMVDEWIKYYADEDVTTNAIARLKDEGYPEPTEADIKGAIIDTLDEAGEQPWFDTGEFDYKTNFTDGYGMGHETMEDAIESVQQEMYARYREDGEMDGAVEIFEEYTVSGGDDYRMEVYRMEDFTSDKSLHSEPHLDQIDQPSENVQVHARMKTRTDADGKTGTVLEEVQSQWEQDWRKQGREAQRVLDKTPPKLATPPIQDRTQYTKVAMLDNLLDSVKKGEDYFGFINGHIQNGSSIQTTVGMSNAYDIEMPRIIQKATGETPYMARFDNGEPVSGTKIEWDGKIARENLDHYDELSEGEWYWRVDYTPEVKTKMKNSKIEMYGVGGVSLMGAASQGEDNDNSK